MSAPTSRLIIFCPLTVRSTQTASYTCPKSSIAEHSTKPLALAVGDWRHEARPLLDLELCRESGR